MNQYELEIRECLAILKGEDPGPQSDTHFAASGVRKLKADYNRLRDKFVPRLHIINLIRNTARDHGWAIGMHGSLERDIDLIGVPWVDPHCTPDELLTHILQATGYVPLAHRLRRRNEGRQSVLIAHPEATFVQTEKGTWTPPCIDLSLVSAT